MNTDSFERAAYRRQTDYIARKLATKLTKEEALGFSRCGGDVLCNICGLSYYDHPELTEGVAKGLTVTCQGKLVKL